MQGEEIKRIVKEGYGRVAGNKHSCCGSPHARSEAGTISKEIGYSDSDIASVPEGANLGLGCGNPTALLGLKEGDVVLDLGSGAGFDCFLAANRVGKTGKVIGVDMTPEMIDKARVNAAKGNYQNVEFRLGEIEHLPVEDASVDVIISNCVVNLSPDKKSVFKESFRVLKPGGCLMVSDIVLLKPLPDYITGSLPAYINCIAGAIMKDDYLKAIEEAGFEDVTVMEEQCFPVASMAANPAAHELIKDFNLPAEKVQELTRSVSSIKVRGKK